MDYKFIKKIKNHDLILDNEKNKLYLKKKFKQDDKELLIKLQKLSKSITIPNIYSVEEIDDHIIVISEYIDGLTLKEFCELHQTIEKKDLYHIIKELTTILKAFKQEMIIHRDIKPSNIIITDNLSIYLIDFDIARIFGAMKNQDTHLLGTEGYASPEQFGALQTDYKSDIYSLGIVVDYIYKKHMKPNKNIVFLINNMIKFDPQDRFDYSDIDKYLSNKTSISDTKFHLKEFIFFRNLNIIWTILLNIFIYYFILSAILDTGEALKADSMFIFILFAITSLFCFILICIELRKTMLHRWLSNLHSAIKFFIYPLYGFIFVFIFFILEYFILIPFNILNKIL